MKIFTEHPKNIGETYFQHFVFATKSGLKMTAGGIACMIHGIFPFLFQTTGSRIAKELQDDFTQRANDSSENI